MTATLASQSEADDAELMRRVQNDDANAFAALYDRFGVPAYWIATGIAHNGTRAEDIVQEAFLSIWRSRAGYQSDLGSVGGWVMGTVRNRALDSLRRNKRHDDRRASSDHIDEHVQATGDLEQTVAERDQAAQLRDALARLPAAQCEVIALAYFGEMSTSEIARELTLPWARSKGACASA
ncbi:MAG: sigma-70 family RNA polymerase sigma factor [Solirubrobacteraceae bacterium]